MTTTRLGSFSVLLVDPHPIFRCALRAVLEADPRLTVVGEVSSGMAAIACTMKLRPAVVATELDLDDGTALPAIRVIRAVMPETRVLVISARTDPLSVLAALEAGADGAVTKRYDADGIVRAVHAVQIGERVLDRDAIANFVARVLDRPLLPPTPPIDRQRIVQAQLKAGATSEEIATALGLNTEPRVGRHAAILDNQIRPSESRVGGSPRNETVPPVEIALSEEQRAALAKVAGAERGVRRWKRPHAILLLAAGLTPSAVAAVLHCAPSSVSTWAAAWRASGLDGLLLEGPHRGAPRRLDATGEATLAALLKQDPRARGHRATGWTVALLRAELAAAGRYMSDRTLRRYLRRLGYRWNFPGFVLGRPDPAHEQTDAPSRSGEVQACLSVPRGAAPAQPEVPPSNPFSRDQGH